MKSVISTFLILVAVIVIFLYLHFHINIAQYRGDGKISKVGHVLIDNGYSIAFDSMPLLESTEKIYKLQKLPKAPQLGIVFILIQSSDIDSIDINSTCVSLSAIDMYGKKIFETNRTMLNKFTMCINGYDSIGFPGTTFLFSNSTSFAGIPRREMRMGNITIKFKVDYVPQNLVKKNLLVRVFFLSGGSI